MNSTVTIAILCATAGLSQSIQLDRPDPVKDAPYSADAITEVTFKAEGPPLVNRTSAPVYRDSQGRERKEEGQSESQGAPQASPSYGPGSPETCEVIVSRGR